MCVSGGGGGRSFLATSYTAATKTTTARVSCDGGRIERVCGRDFERTLELGAVGAFFLFPAALAKISRLIAKKNFTTAI